jgi:tetratricopeptide (TPR) repeat protein
MCLDVSIHAMKRTIYALNVLCLLLPGFTLKAQQSAIYRDPDLDLKDGIELFSRSQFGAAKTCFTSYLERTEGHEATSRADAAFYQAMCAIHLDHDNGEALVENFLEEYPESAKANLARFEMGKILFQEKKFKRAQKWLQQVKPGKLDRDLDTEYKFYMGYSLFEDQDYKQSLPLLEQVSAIPGPFQDPAKYYLHYTQFMAKDYDKSMAGFEQLQSSREFGISARICLAQIYYYRQRYQDAVNIGSQLIRNTKPEQQAEMNRIMGDSYFRLGRYPEAVSYLELYRKGSKAMSRDEHYALGYAYYMTGKNQEAVKELEQVSDAGDNLTQSSSHLLGGILVNLNDKLKARSAFRKAANINLDKQIQEESLFNYAKLNYDLKISGETLRAFEEFLSAFPDSRYQDEVYDYLVKVFMSTRNYQEALATLDKIRNKTPEVRKAYQRIAYYRGLELFNNLKYREAIDMFDRSAEFGTHDPQIRALAYYWQGEAWYNLKAYEPAMEGYEKFLNDRVSANLPEYGRALYSIGYSWFSLEDYSQAQKWFQRFAAGAGKQDILLAEVYNRIGDCFFMNRTYWQAIEYYDRAVAMRNGDAPYAMFQKGLSLGLVQRPAQKIEILRKLLTDYPKSQYADDAIYEIGRSHTDLGESPQAIQAYRELIDKFPNSSYVRKAFVQLGLIFYNTDRNEEALTMYKKVVTTWPDSQEAVDALTGIKNVYVDDNRVDDYLAYVQSTGRSSSISVSEQDSLIYTGAENLYMQGDCARAGQSFTQYISRFPQGRFLINAHYYKADCNYRSDQMDDALNSYDYILTRGRNDFTELALARSAGINYLKSNFGRALVLYQQLERQAEDQNNLMDARAGIMRCSLKQNDFNGVIAASRNLLSMDKVPANLVREASFNLGKAYLETGEQEKALEILTTVATDVKNAEGAEAKYLKADLLFRRGLPDQAEKEILEFLDLNTTHQYWLAKAYILWSDIYVKRMDFFQAKSTLEILKENYTRQDDGIIRTVDEKLNWINTQNQEK